MDRTDLALCKLFLENSRIPIREIGDRLNLSAAAVHGRIQALRDAGIIKAFTAKIGLFPLRSSITLVWGTSRARSNEEVRSRLETDDHVYWVAFGGAGSVYVGTYLRSPAELDAVASFIAKEAEIPDPAVGLLPMGSGLPDEPVLDRLDARILRALHRDARRSVADVAEEIGLSAKTVGRRLGKMVREGIAELSMEWYPDVSNDIITIWHIDLAPSASREPAVALLTNKYGGNLLFTMAFANLPRFLLAGTWAGSMKELRDLQEQIGHETPIARAVPNVLYTGYMFDTWRDELITKWAGAKERTG